MLKKKEGEKSRGVKKRKKENKEGRSSIKWTELQAAEQREKSEKN